MKNFKKGFTLAEVLITLSIIGIVAAIVMPSVMSSYQYKTIGVKLSKFASTLEQSARAYVVMNDTLNANNVLDMLNDSLILRAGESGQLGVEASSSGGANTLASAPEATGSGGLLDTDLSSGAVFLKDNTQVAAYSRSYNDTDYTNAKIDREKVGNVVALLAFNPNVKGLPSVAQKNYNFAITELGYIFPDISDTCLTQIAANQWSTNSAMYKDGGACSSNRPASAASADGD